MNSIYNNIKGVIGVFFLTSLLFSGYSCSQGTDEDLISPEQDSAKMNINPKGCLYYLVEEDETDNKPQKMLFVVSRVLKSWRNAFIVGFDEQTEGIEYQGDILECLGNVDSAKFVASKYHAMSFTYAPDVFDYSKDLNGFLFGKIGVTQFVLPYNVDLDKKINSTPVKLYSSYLDNYTINEFYNDSYIMFDPVCYTQRYEWEFYIKKTDSIACVDAIEAEIYGIPCAVELRTGNADVSSVVKAKVFGQFSHEDNFDPGRDTVRITLDALPILSSLDARKLQLVEEEVGNMMIRMTIRNKKGNVKDWVLRHNLTEITPSDSTEERVKDRDHQSLYSLNPSTKMVSKVKGAPVKWEYTIDDEILINLDTVNTRRYGKWQVVK